MWNHLYPTRPVSPALNGLNIIFPTPYDTFMSANKNAASLPHQTGSAMAASFCKPFYQRLKKLPQDTADEEFNGSVVFKGRRNGWLRLNRGGRWRPPPVRVAWPRRLLRRKARAVGAAVKLSVTKVLKRLKEGRPYLGELFAGNYMFMQVSPSPTLPYVEKSFLPAGKNHFQHGLLPPSTIRFNVPRVPS